MKTKISISLGWVVAAALLAVIFFMQKCGGSEPNVDITSKTIYEYGDTVTLVKLDTVWLEKTVYLPPIVLPAPEIAFIDSTTVNSYTGTHTDSLLSIEYTALTLGSLEALDFNYTLKKPLFVDRVITKTVTNTEHTTESSYITGFYLGGSVGYSAEQKQPAITLGMTVTLPSKFALSYDFELLSETSNFGVKYRLGK